MRPVAGAFYTGFRMVRDRHGVRAWHVLAGALAVGSVACAGILGIDDRQLDTSDGGTSQQEGGTQDGPSNADAPANADGPAMGDAPSNSDAPSQTDGGTGDSGPAASCDGGPCVLATGLNHPFLMASDSKNVYWTEFGDDQGSGNGAVKGCPLDGCGSGGPTVYATALTNPRGIVSDGTNVYFGTATYSAVNGGIWSCSVNGCNGSPTQLTVASVPFGLAVDSTYVYWADYEDSSVHRVLKTGGTDDVLYDGGGNTVESEEVAVDTTSVYFTDYNGDVFKIPLAGGNPALMATWGQGGGWPLKVDSTSVYYGQPGGVSVMSKTATDGGSFLVNNLQDPLGISLDPPTGRLYWADYGSPSSDNSGTIGRIALDGGGRTLIASSQINMEDVTVSGSYVFWISNGLMVDGMGNALPSTGALYRMPK